VTYAKIQNVADNKVLGNFSGSTGSVQELATTGTGNVVRATSPTLVTPNLGTPSAIDLTNATALPLTAGAGVTGVLPVANGGTGSNSQNFVDLTTNQTIDGVKTFSGTSTVVNQNLTVNAAGTTGQGIILSDDGDIVDNNDGAATFRFTGGVKINNGNKSAGTTTNITLSNTGNITASGSITASQITSNVATGNPPLVVTSTTPVANLNIGGNAANVTGIVGISNGGTGSSTQNFVDLTTAQTVAGAKTFSGNTAVGGTLGVTGATTLSSTLAVTGNTTIGGTSTLNGNTAVSGSNTFTVGTGATALGGTLTVTGATTLNGNTAVSGSNTLTVGTGATTLGGTLGVTGNTTVGGTLGVTGATTLSSTLGVTGNTTVGGTTTLNGNTSVSGSNTFTVGTGATTLGGALTVAGATTLNGTLTIPTGAAAGEILTSDANGVASWSYSSGSVVVQSTTPYSIRLQDSYVFYTGSSNGAFTLPTGVTGKEITIKNKTANTITISGTSIYVDKDNTAASSVTVGNEASNNWIRLVFDGTQWVVFRALF
jgi:hypothetical protein